MKHMLLLVVFAALAWPCQAESFKGTVYANSSGASARGSGMIRLAVGSNRIDELYYSKPLPKKFSSPKCSDIGAIWSVEVKDATDVVSAQCDGKLDEEAHGPWLLIKEFLDRLRQSSPASFDLFTSRWRNSADSQGYREKLKALDLSSYLTLGTGALCLEVVSVSRGEGTEMQTGADCHLRLQGKLVELSFNVVRNKSANRWEIDSINIR
jgi:hypothetical protein